MPAFCMGLRGALGTDANVAVPELARADFYLSSTNTIYAPGHGIAPEGDLADPDGRFEKTVGIGAQGALLLRPDAVIGWRTAGSHPDPRAKLEHVMKQLTLRR